MITILAITGYSKACLHEAAHAIVAVVMGLDVNYACVADSSDGETDIDQTGERYAADLTVVAIAGKVIEDALGRRRELRWTSDWGAATRWAAEAVGKQQDAREVSVVLRSAYSLAVSVLEHAKPAVRSLAKQLRKTGRAAGADCKACLTLAPAGDLAMLQREAASYRAACAELAAA